MNFRCNYRKCRKELIVSALVTSCSHIFCLDHNPGKIGIEFCNSTKRRDIKCPVCKTNLNQTFDFVEVDLQPPDAFKGMVLTGLKPETIIEITARSLGFWMYQMEQELQYYQYVIKKQLEKSNNVESEFIKAYNCLNEEKSILLTEKENLSRECEELREKLIIESRTIEKMAAELKYLSVKEHKQTHFNVPESIPRGGNNQNDFGNKMNPVFPGMGQQYSSMANRMMKPHGHNPNTMMISPDSTLSSPSNMAVLKSDQANRIWSLTQNHCSKPDYQNSFLKQQGTNRKYLSPLDNILNKKSDLSTFSKRRLPNSLESISSSQLSYGFN